MRTYLALRAPGQGGPLTPDSPLFALPNGNPLTRNVLTDGWKKLLFRAAVPYTGRGISFRAGGISRTLILVKNSSD